MNIRAMLAGQEETLDWRLLENGLSVPADGYADQPYIVIANDGAWVCTLTTGSGCEGEDGEYVSIVRSTDRGKTWSSPLRVEPDRSILSAYSVLYKAPGGRIFCLYNVNADRITRDDIDLKRYDMMGDFCFRFSDDGGITWSGERYEIPVRDFEVDRLNPLRARGKELRFRWNVGRPFAWRGAFYVPLIKFSHHTAAVIGRSEGVLLKSPNLPDENDPLKIRWETLPDGKVGLRSPPGGGPIAEEQSVVPLSDGTLYAVYRTVDGHPAFSRSTDDGHSFCTPEYLRYANGRPVKHPRAANFVWKCENGRYLYWFHNNGEQGYDDRNPVWLCAGRETGAPEGKTIAWGQPEILLYDDSEYTIISYPDFVEDGGHCYVTETQKHLARLHEIPSQFLQALWRQEETEDAADDSVLFYCAQGAGVPEKAPLLPIFSTRDRTAFDFRKKDARAGFSIDFWVTDGQGEDALILNGMTPAGRGLLVERLEVGSIRITLSDGRSTSVWDSERLPADAGPHHVSIIIDGGPKIICFVVNGILNDGGAEREFGFGRFNRALLHLNFSDTYTVGPGVERLAVHGRPLMVTEMIGRFRSMAGKMNAEAGG